MPCFFARLSICVTKLALYGTRLPPSRFCRNGKTDPTLPYPTDQKAVFVTQRSLAQGLLSSWTEVRELRENPKRLQFAIACQHKRQAKKIPGSNLGGRERLRCQGGLPPQPLGGDWGVQIRYGSTRVLGDRGVPIRSYSLGPHRFFESSCRFHLLHFLRSNKLQAASFKLQHD